MSDNIKVVVKVRPLISREIEAKQHHQWRVEQNTLLQIDSSGRDKAFGQAFIFDKVYSEDTQTSDVYNDVAKPIVEAAVAGFNGTIFAYGQTSSGKTYTMTGNEEYPGIIPLAVLNLFKSIKNIPDRDFVVSVSYIEIYNETVRDLLNPKEIVKVKETLENSVKVQATEKVTASPEEVLEAMKEGNVNRQTGSTNMNESSSRSHSIFQINIESREHIDGDAEAGCVNVSQLNLVDLAGSERAGQTGATGIRFKEGTLINKSLTSLALVIKQLSEDTKYINYRDSKLTRILQNSLGGNAKTSIICAITPAALEETISTLQFATRAKVIKNKPEVNAVATDATMIQKLTKELSKLQSQLEKKKNLEVILETKKNKEQDLQKKIANLQRFILNGFGQRPNVEQMDGARKKKPLSRRITISTTSVLHPIVEDSPNKPTRKFCTPSLKYNPASIEITSDSDFVPIQKPSKLGSVPEEPPRLITPPPNNRKVNVDDEVIKLDSDDDDDESSATKTCSPYHDCYGANKTPPCVLRKNAAAAEKDLEELIELTEREKMYPPEVVELLEKLDKSYSKSVKLQDEVELLKKTSQDKDLEIETLRRQINSSSQEKDLEIEKLRRQINSTEQEVKSLTSITSQLETQSELYNTHLTEWEVKYETQKYKAKLREEELLSLIEGNRIEESKKPKPYYEDIGKMPFKPKDKELTYFMDMSKDISLVNSDNESSVTQNDDESSESRNVLLNDMQAQLKAKNDLISDLQSKITSQRKQIESLEKSSHDLLNQVSDLKEKFSYFENENIALQSSVNELNATIKIQKESMELAQNDIKSYTSLIQELQIKLTEKDNLPSLNANDEVFEKLLATEEKTIANNENLQNIINSLKRGLENSKKEINLLKTKMSIDNEGTVKMLKDDIAKLQKLGHENVVTINTLTREKNNLSTIEQEFVKKISETEQKNIENFILIKEQASQIDILKNENKNLEASLVANINIEKESSKKTNESLLKQIDDATNNILTLEEEVKCKDIYITNLNTQINEYQVCFDTAKLGISKLQNVLLALTGEAKEIPQQLDNFLIIYNTLNDKLNGLETIAQETVSQKEKALKDYMELQQDMTEILTKHKLKVTELTENIENVNQKVQNLTSDIEVLIGKNGEQLSEIEKLKLEINDKNNIINELNFQVEINNQNNDVNSEKDLAIKALQKTEIELSKTIEKLQQDMTEILTKHKLKVTELTENIENVNQKVQNLTSDIEVLIGKNGEQLSEIEKLKLEINDKNNVINELNFQVEINNQNNDVNSEKDLAIKALQKTEIELSKTIEKLNMEALNYITEIKSKEEIIHELRDRNTISTHELNKLKEELNHRESELIQCQQKLNNANKTTELLIEKLTETLNNIIENIMGKNPSFEYRLYEISNTQEQLFHILERISNYVSMQSPIFIENEKLTSDLKIISHNNKSLKVDLIHSNELLQKLQEELKNKSAEISAIEQKTKEYQGQFSTFGEEMKEQIQFLQLENEKLKARSKHLNEETNIRLSQLADDETYSQKTTFRRSSCDLKNYTEIWSPPSLLTICCNRISKAIDSKHNEASDTTSSSNKESSDTRSSEYDELLHELAITQQENEALMTYKEQLEIENKELIIERVQMQSEVLQLLEETEELQKKLFNHKTILTILTATTYTENTSLKSQLKGLQHHHSRFQNVCQRDIPELKKELNNLMSILKDDSGKRYSLPIFRNNSIHNCPSKNDSTLDGDLLMLDTNVTVTTADNTLVGNQTCLDYTQTMFNETGCQTLDYNCTDSNLLSGHLAMELEVVKKENEYLKKKIYNESKVDVQCSPIKIADFSKEEKLEELKTIILSLKEQLAFAKNEKEILETRYNDLVLEMPSINTLVQKINIVEDQLKAKENETAKVTKVLQDRNKELREIQEENDSLSNQIMEHISEADDLNKEVEKLRQQNIELNALCQKIRDDNDDKRSAVAGSTVEVQQNNSNICMDLDESLNFEMAHDSVPCSPQSKKCNISDIQEERPLDLYMVDKNECYNFYLQEIGTERENLPNNATIIEIMKKLHSILVTKHGNEVENLVNKLKDQEESQIKLRNQINDINASYLNLKNELEEKDISLSFIYNVITQLRDNLIDTKECRLNFEAIDKSSNLSIVKMLENVTNHSNKIVQDYNTLKEVFTETKCQLSEKEKECNSLKAVNEKIQEINKAVTLDIIKKEQEINKAIEKMHQNLLDDNMISIDQFPLNEPVNVRMLIRYLEHFVKEYRTEKANAVSPSKINDMKIIIEEKERQIKEILSNVEVLETRNKEMIEVSKGSQHELDVVLKNKTEENDRNVMLIENLTEEIRHLKHTLNNKDDFLKTIAKNITLLSNRKDIEASELLCTIQSIQDENDKLKAINEILSKETESYASELEKSCAIIAQNNMDLDKMTSEILVLRESVKEATTHVDSLKQEVLALTDKNIEVERELEIKCRDCQRLEINIKTHEKTAEIQSRMITRLQKLKEDDDKANKERLDKLNELSETNESLQKECEELKITAKSLTEEIEHIKTIKESLENRLVEFEDSGRRSRMSIDANADCSKRRRQSLHDTKRLFDKLEEHKNLEAAFASRQKPDDFFMDVNNESLSGRSTPLEGGKGRDSLLSRTEHSDKDDDHSRPNSALARATRRRRQSSHDLHRSVTPQGDLSHFVIDEVEEGATRIRMNTDNEITQLKAQLATCETELQEFKIKYRELDEECEICSQYLQERDDQCSRLKKEKTALEKEVAELKSNPFSNTFSFKMKPSVAHVSVNTDEDWANLHSVVVDRMSYDAEVEKNKKLTKMVEELRFKKLDLRKTIDKMQKALERKDNSRELDHAKQELRSCKAELEALRQKYKELDEECETCAAYLKEREEQCRQLKEARAELEAQLKTAKAKIEELHEKVMGEHSKTVRKKRQTVHDMNRPHTSAVEQTDATTETTYDGSQGDTSAHGEDKPSQILHLKKIVERLSMQKAHLEDQLRLAYSAQPICVATGSAIVQNQQISDVMKENQKLKKINAKLVTICKKRGKSANRENEDPCEQG